MKKLNLLTIAAILTWGLSGAACFADATITIGTGEEIGVYYHVGKAISETVNSLPDSYIRSQVKTTTGSVYNIKSVMGGFTDLAIAQSDRQYQACKGLAEWKSLGPQQKLRSIFSLHSEAITLVAADQSGIQSIDGLTGKVINIGKSGSGQIKNSNEVMQAFGIPACSITIKNSSSKRYQQMMEAHDIDAFFYTIGHPSSLIDQISKKCKVSIIPLTGPGADTLISHYPYYAKALIPKKLYPHILNQGDVETVGVKATLVTSTALTEATVYTITKAIFTNLNKFKKHHAALCRLTPESMLKGLSAPIHPGALKYYREAGLIGLIDPGLMAKDI